MVDDNYDTGQERRERREQHRGQPFNRDEYESREAIQDKRIDSLTTLLAGNTASLEQISGSLKTVDSIFKWTVGLGSSVLVILIVDWATKVLHP
jgi:hypothetical protein